MTTTVIAIFVGAGIFALIHPGDPSLMTTIQGAATSATVSTEGTSVSVLDTIVDIVPSNFIQPFLDSNMMQIIFIAVLCGVEAGHRQLLGALARLLRGVQHAIPQGDHHHRVDHPAGGVLLHDLAGHDDGRRDPRGPSRDYVAGLACMIAIYCLLLALVGRLNPLTFLRKYAPTMLTCFSLSSSSASMPFNIKACQDTLGVSPKVC